MYKHFGVPTIWQQGPGILCVPHLLQDLTWDDREKVLRLLFAKLNDPKQQSLGERPLNHTPLS
jgi:hypothetical protein